MQQVFFIGGGAIATALGNVLAMQSEIIVTLFTIEKDVVETINNLHINRKYFPGIKLCPDLKASGDFSLLEQEAIVFVAIPSVVVINFIEKQKIHPQSLLVNLAKGFGCEKQTIVDCLVSKIPNPVCTLKGPSFAREIINNQPTSFTVGANDENHYFILKSLFENTSIYLDHSEDVIGVEMLSILKNIYAIVIGVVDAQFESPNLRFMIFTKAFKEMRRLMIAFGGSKKTLFNYCGIGDFALTSLSDLSRNRTLGLLIGKGFFTEYISEKVVLEGRIAVNIYYDELKDKNLKIEDYPILHELYKVFNTEYDISKFVGNLLKSNGTNF
jgi:glycerol-3-phosphate dehydrogenase (NAD(P)+)